tara:strand:- start:506 stop:3937 length:3432 start_codon:yes stop_codon:yes gene_type:complete
MANKKFIQKARNKMKRKGTVGAFTEYCGGRVTQRCIDKAKRSDDVTLRRRAVFAENMRNIGNKKKAQDGVLQIPGIQPAAIEQNIAAPQLQVPGASIAEDVKSGLNLGGAFQDAGMTLAGKGQELLGNIKSGEIGVSGATDLLAKGATALINKGSDTAKDALRDDQRERTGAAVGGAISGAGKGFDMGNKIIPGLGGAIGAGIGAIGGAFGGKKKQEKGRLDAVRQLREKQAGQYGDILKAQSAFTARAGGMKLPGGQMLPLPDGGKLYKGRKHESGGIDLKRDNIEVEGGETERKIIAADGKPIDYIFSEHHKVGKKIQAKYGVGKNTSYADIHRKMEEGGIAKNYQELAKDQEDDMKKKGKNQYGPRGSKYIKKYGGLKEGIAKIKAQDGVPAWKQRLLDKGFVEDPDTGAMLNPQAAKDKGLTGGKKESESKVSGKTREQIAEEMTAKFAKEDKNMAALQEGKLPQTEAEAKYLEDRMKSGEASEGERKAFVAYQNVGGRTMDKIKNQAETARAIASDPELATDAAQLGLGAIAASEIPVVSQVAGGLNTLGYGARSLYYGSQGKGLKAGLYGTLAGGSALGMVPAAGAAMDVTTGIRALDKLNKGIAAKTLGAADRVAKTKAGKLILKGADKVDDADAAVELVGKGVAPAKLTHGAHNVEQGLHVGSTIDKEIGLATGGKYKPSKIVMGSDKTKTADTPGKSRYGGAKMKAQFSLPPQSAMEAASVMNTNATEEAQETTPPAPANQSRPKFDVFANKEEGDAFRQWLNTNMPEEAKRLDLDPEGSHTNAYIRRAWGEFGDDFEVSKADEEMDEQQFQEGQAAVDAIAEEAKTETTTDTETEEEKSDEVVDEARANTPGDSESTVEETTALRENIRDLKKANRAVPPEALAAMAAQTIAPIYALTQKPPRVGGYAPQSYQAPKLGRVSGRADKDRVDQNMTALLASMEGQAMGPAAAANYANLLNQAQQQKGQIDQRTQQANMQLAAREAMMQTQASQFNIQQNQRAQEYMRNLALMQNQEEFANKFGALQALGQGVAGSLGDVMAYKADERVARINVADTLDKEGRTALERADIAAIEKRRELDEKLREAREKDKKAKQAAKAEKKKAKKDAREQVRQARQARSGGYIARSGIIRRTKR